MKSSFLLTDSESVDDCVRIWKLYWVIHQCGHQWVEKLVGSVVELELKDRKQKLRNDQIRCLPLPRGLALSEF